MNITDKQIIVIGAYRSGTSMLANILHTLGIDMGHKANGKDKDKWNKDGYFECYKAIAINNSFIRQTKRRYVSIDSNISKTIKEKNETKIQEYIKDRNKKEIWGLKDPRLIPFWYIWEKFLNNPLPIIIRRNIEDIIKSLKRKDNIGREISKNMVNNYDLIFREIESRYNCLSLFYEDVVKNPIKNIFAICDYLNFPKTGIKFDNACKIPKKII